MGGTLATMDRYEGYGPDKKSAATSLQWNLRGALRIKHLPSKSVRNINGYDFDSDYTASFIYLDAKHHTIHYEIIDKEWYIAYIKLSEYDGKIEERISFASRLALPHETEEFFH